MWKGSAEIREEIRKFEIEHRDDDCMFAFIGHGIEVNDRTYLVAADSKLGEYPTEAKYEQAVRSQCVSFEQVKREFKVARGKSDAVPCTVFLLDCCRKTGKDFGGAGSALRKKAAAKIVLENSIVFYSTTSGKIAGDGWKGKGGPFMGIFCKEIVKPGATVADVVWKTRDQLFHSKPKLFQLAEDNSFLFERFFFSAQREQQVSRSPFAGP